MTDHLTASTRTITLSVDPSRPVPLYQQLSEGLRQLVILQEWPVDSAIPSERELMRLTGLSRMTVRQAIDSLTREGLLRRVHGRGTFIVPDRVDQDLAGVYSFSQRMLSEGILIRTVVIDATMRPATPNESEILGLPLDAPVFWLIRVREIEGDPLVVNRVVLPADRFPGLLDHDMTGSLYGLMTDLYESPPLTSIDTMEAVAAPRDIAEWLGVKMGSPISLVSRVARTYGGVPVEITQEFARSDRMRYRLQQWADPVLERTARLIPEEVHA